MSSVWQFFLRFVYSQFGEPIDFSDIITKYVKPLNAVSGEEEKKMQYDLYKEITDRVELVFFLFFFQLQHMEELEYKLKDMRKNKVYVQ